MRLCVHGPVLLVAAFFAASCDAAKATRNMTEPTTISTALSVSLNGTSSTAVAQRVSDFRCPSISPFTLPVLVMVDAKGAAAPSSVTEIRLQFTDQSGVRLPQVTLPAPVPTTQFGTALANSLKAFPVTLGIGCGSGHAGTLVIVVDMRDGRGHRGSAQTTVLVR
jgi:hypothetical protein